MCTRRRMKRACPGADTAPPNGESAQAPPDLPELPSDVWFVVGRQLVRKLCEEADALEKRDANNKRKGGGWEVVHASQVTALALVNRATASSTWQGLYFVAGYAAFQQAAESVFVARRSSHLRWTLRPPEIWLQNLVLNALRTAYYAHMDMLKAVKRKMINTIRDDKRAEAKGLIAAMRALRDETSIVDRIYSIGSNVEQLSNNRVAGYKYREGTRANDLNGKIITVTEDE